MNITKPKNRLKPLALGDIIVVLINQQSTTDRTQIYKEILANNYVASSESC